MGSSKYQHDARGSMMERMWFTSARWGSWALALACAPMACGIGSLETDTDVPATAENYESWTSSEFHLSCAQYEAAVSAGGGVADAADVALGNADILGSRVLLDGTRVHIQILFAAEPFASPNTQDVEVLFDKDDDPCTGQPAVIAGGVWAFDTFVGTWDGAASQVPQFLPFDAQVAVSASCPRLLEFTVPIVAVTNDGHVRYAVASAFSGSFGANDRSPDVAGAFWTEEAARTGSDCAASSPSSPPSSPSSSSPLPTDAQGCDDLTALMAGDAPDVTLPNADILGSRAMLEGSSVRVQILFAAEPFGCINTRHVSVLFDKDDDPATGQTGGINGEVWAFDTWVATGNGTEAETPQSEAFEVTVTTMASCPRALEFIVPLSAVSDDGDVRYAVGSAFGGSFGANDASPETGGTFWLCDSEAGAGDCSATTLPPVVPPIPPYPPVPTNASCADIEAAIRCDVAACDTADVSLANADIVASWVLRQDATVHVQILFADEPFACENTRFVHVFFDKDGDPCTGQTGGIAGHVWAFDTFVGTANGTTVDAPPMAPFAPSASLNSSCPRLLDFVVPLAAVSDDGAVRYMVGSAFGGSFGANDASPDTVNAFWIGGTGQLTAGCPEY